MTKICRQFRIAAESEQDVVREVSARWPGWTIKLKRSPVPHVNGQNWYDVMLVKEVPDE